MDEVRWSRDRHESLERVEIDGRPLVPFRAVVDLAHRSGLVSVDVTESFHDPVGRIAAHRAVVQFADGSSFANFGFAAAHELPRRLSGSYYLVSATRAIGRALAIALNLESNLAEELLQAESSNVSDETAIGSEEPLRCASCNEPITDSPSLSARQKAEISIRQTGQVLCYRCYREHQKPSKGQRSA